MPRLLKNEIRNRPAAFVDLIDRNFPTVVVCDVLVTKRLKAANMTETPMEFIVEVLGTGYKREDFKLKLEENMLTIDTELKVEEEKESDRYTRKEFRRSSFGRTFRMSKGLASDKVDAKYEKGILKIELPKKVEIITLIAREIVIS